MSAGRPRAWRVAAALALLAGAPVALPPTALGAQVPAMPTDPRQDVALRFVRALERGDFADAAALWSPDGASGAMPAERLRQVWGQLTGQLGALLTLSAHPVTEDGGRATADLAARFARSEVTLRVVLDAASRLVGFWVTPPRPPAYEPPAYVDTSAFREVELRVGAEPTLPAVLTLPRGGGPAPVVVLVHGSGPSDRDETIGANRPFRDLAWGLASQGIAVLRYEKRTYAQPRSLPADITVEHEVIADALSALEVARGAEGVDAARVFVLGHSLGAGLAPEIAARDGRVAGVVMLAAPARPSAEVLTEQLRYVHASAGAAGAAAGAQLDSLLALLQRLRERAIPADEELLGVRAGYWYDLDDRRPVERARALAAPMLLLFGGRDYQVTDADAALWRQGLSRRAGVELRTYPELSHLFTAGEGMATPAEYMTRTAHVAPAVIADVARWVREQRR